MSNRSKRPQFVRQLRSELLESRYAMDGSCAGTSAHLEISPPINYFIKGDPVVTSTTTSGATLGPVSIANVPAYSSLPGAADTLYLDFNGHFEATWGSYSNITTPAYSTDSDFATFSDQEQANIQSIWAQVAEDFAPFKINVTTVEPASFANGVGLRVAIGGSSYDWLGSGAGGVGYINSYTNSIVNTVYVFPAQLSNGTAKYVGEAASHESGHAFGLQHQSLYDANGNLVSDYYSGANGKAPVMGNSYVATRGLWWNGTSTSSTTIQDDMAVIARSTNTFGYRADDHGNTVSTASALTLNGSQLSGAGVITQTTDVDYFSFSTNPGTITLSVSVPTNNNLDSVLELQNTSGSVLASAAPTNSFGVSLTFNVVTGGSYRLVVKSQGNYGDVGQYTVSGTVIPLVSNSIAAPTNLAATITTGTTVGLSWSDNASNETNYVVSRSIDNGATWATLATLSANSTTFFDTTISAGQTVSYRVQGINATDVSLYSNTAAVTLAPESPSNLIASATTTGTINLTWTDVAGETSYKILRSLDNLTFTQVGTTSANGSTYNDTGLASSTTYYYAVVASNTGGDSATSVAASATTITAVSLPAAPSGLKVAGATSSTVSLTWTDNASKETGFYIERRTGSRGNFSVIATAGADATSFTDGSVAAGKSYTYRVRAFNSAGASAASNTVSVTTPKTSSTKGPGKGNIATSASEVDTSEDFQANDFQKHFNGNETATESFFRGLGESADEFWLTIWSN